MIPLLADRIGPLNTITPVALSVAIVSLSWLAVNSVSGLFAFTAFYGLVSGAFQCLMPTGVASITRRLDMVGTRMGMCFTILSFAALTGPPLGGALQAANSGQFQGAQGWAGASSLACAILLGVSRTLKARSDFPTKC